MTSSTTRRRTPTEDYLRRCRSEGTGLARCMAQLTTPTPGTASTASTAGLLARPMFERLSTLSGVADDALRVLRVLESLPERCFGGSQAEYLSAQGLSPRRAALIDAGCVGMPARYGRVDVLMRRQTPRMIEINVGSDIGGLTNNAINRALLRHPRFAEFAREHQLTYVDPVRSLAAELLAVARSVVGTDDPAVAIVEESDAARTGQPLADELRSLGLNTSIGELGDLSMSGGKIVIHGRFRVDVVVRCFFVSHLLDEPDGMRTVDMLAQAHKNGQTALFTPLDAAVHESKATFALLYEPAVWRTLSEEERSLVDRCMPWTRLIGSAFRFTTTEDRFDLIEQCRARRTELVLKPALLTGGAGVVMGDQVSDDEWQQALEAPDLPDYVVQERVPIDQEEIVDPVGYELVPWIVNWGVMFNSNGYGGACVSARHAAGKGVIGVNSGTRRGCVFTYEQPTPERADR